MNDPTLTRRDLHRLALAALGGLAAGLAPGCGPAPSSAPEKASSPNGGDKEKPKDTADKPSGEDRLLQDPHVCRGINTCKNKGKTGTENTCAGTGHCATAKAHSCQGQNDCKGQSGCDGKNTPGENECKGKGACEVPLSKKTWPLARKKFEELMTKAGKKFGDAPPS